MMYPLANHLYQQRGAGYNMQIQKSEERKQCHVVKRSNLLQ